MISLLDASTFPLLSSGRYSIPVNVTPCTCNTVYYNLLTACAFCQGGAIEKSVYLNINNSDPLTFLRDTDSNTGENHVPRFGIQSESGFCSYSFYGFHELWIKVSRECSTRNSGPKLGIPEYHRGKFFRPQLIKF